VKIITTIPKKTRAAKTRSREDGYILLAVLFLVFMVMLTLAIAAPKVAADIQRDREVELVHRGKQYVRAVKLYYKKFGAYPPNLDALVNTNQIRFLRKKYKDPMTGKDDWKLIHFGENKTPSYGFFGQPLGGVGGSPVAGVGPGGLGQNPGAVTQSNFGNSSTPGGSSFGSSSFGSSGYGSGGLGSGGLGNSGSGSPIGGATGNSGTDPNAGNTGGASGTTGTSGSGTGTGTGTDPNSPGSGTNSAFGSTGQTFGGGGVIGVESVNVKTTILLWKKKNHFNEWEFWYDPSADRLMISNNAGTIGTPAAGAGNSGSTFSSGGINSTGAAPSSSINPTPAQPAPTPPQQ